MLATGLARCSAPKTRWQRLALVAAVVCVGSVNAAHGSTLGTHGGLRTVAHRRAAPPPVGALTQLPGRRGCLVGSATPGCRHARALRGPGPLLGSDAVALSPDGRNLYAASRRSRAIAVFRRNVRTGTLRQERGRAGCVSAGGIGGCGFAVGLAGPNSIAVSGDGKTVYATSVQGNSLAVFRRNRATGALTQLRGAAGCISGSARRRCASALGLDGPDVVAVSADGQNVYVGAFLGDAVLTFSRNEATGALGQLSGHSGCIAAATAGCASGLALGRPEGLAVSADGRNVYVASPFSAAVDVFARNSQTGALTQARDGTGCLASTPQTGCQTARGLRAADAVAISPDDRSVYVAALSGSVAVFNRALGTGELTQPAGPAGCVELVRLEGCSLARPLGDPEGLAVSADGASVYLATFIPGALDVFDRDAATGALTQKPGPPGCFTTHATRRCTRTRGGVHGASSVAVSPDGRDVYAVANVSNSITVFRRHRRARRYEPNHKGGTDGRA